jgi:prepilin peptidase CpaA
MHLDLETLLAFALTAVACLVGAVVDVRTRRIPNLVTFGAMAASLALHGLFSGLPGLANSAMGLAGCFLVMLVPHLFKVLGAGDVKLMAAVGAGLGANAVISAVIFTSLAGGAQVVVWLAWRRVFMGRFDWSHRLCYGPAIAIGAGVTMALALAGFPYLAFEMPTF